VKRIRIVVADDHRLFLVAVQAVLESADDIEIVAEAHDGANVLPVVGRTRPDLVLLDLSMPQVDGFECLDAIRARHPGVKVAIISGSHDPQVIETALRHGACAFILKSINPTDLAAVIRHVMSGTVIQSLGLPEPRPSAPAESAIDLTERELSILQALARGLSNDAIAKELWIAQPTVKFHVRNVYRKLGVSNRTEAARYAYENGRPRASEQEGGERAERQERAEWQRGPAG
jgi:DNA-binding NarL/FixJ family response regulator